MLHKKFFKGILATVSLMTFGLSLTTATLSLTEHSQMSTEANAYSDDSSMSYIHANHSTRRIYVDDHYVATLIRSKFKVNKAALFRNGKLYKTFKPHGFNQFSNVKNGYYSLRVYTNKKVFGAIALGF